MGPYYLTAVAIVFAIPVAALALVAGTVLWARDAVAREPRAGLVGILCTLVAAGNLFVERSCAGNVNRPVITAFVGADACQRSSLVAVELVVLLAVATALVVRAGEIRRPRRA